MAGAIEFTITLILKRKKKRIYDFVQDLKEKKKKKGKGKTGYEKYFYFAVLG